MVAIARRDYPDLRFEVGSMTDLDLADDSVGGIVAFWSVINVIVLFFVCMMSLQAPMRRSEERFELDEPIWIVGPSGMISSGRSRVSGSRPAPSGRCRRAPATGCACSSARSVSWPEP